MKTIIITFALLLMAGCNSMTFEYDDGGYSDLVNEGWYIVEVNNYDYYDIVQVVNGPYQTLERCIDQRLDFYLFKDEYVCRKL